MQKSTNSDTSVETPSSTRQGTGAVQMRIKNAHSHHDRLSQSKSMILTDVGKVTEPVSQIPLIPQACLYGILLKKKNQISLVLFVFLMHEKTVFVMYFVLPTYSYNNIPSSEGRDGLNPE